MHLRRSQFTGHLVRLNNLQFIRWIFDPGMLFQSESKWWGDKGDRGHCHNGLDLRSYETPDGTYKTISGDTKVPIIYEGKIVRSIKNFIGYTLFAAHEIFDDESQLFTVYGHVTKTAEIFPERLLPEGTVIATLAEREDMRVPHHLHISIALIPKTIPPETMTWKTLDESADVTFLDPRHIIHPVLLSLP
jgi:hypothetical protein